MQSPFPFLDEEQSRALVAAIARAELHTSGEIKVHLEPHCPINDVMERAAEVFNRLEMYKTVQRNGVLIYIAYSDHRFAVLGDEGINRKVPPDFWNEVIEIMKTHFTTGDFLTGITAAIEQCGRQLEQFFPREHTDVNELSDEISRG
ncbi:MAG: TPM domain-containing protein [Chitinophagales bacterium]|nr:TPM domain-containing protein [Chitinophagales bacterium]MDW8419465.1 TPM domain-containing protein [Chitinophagales bacterium]